MKYKTIFFDFYHTLINLHIDEHSEKAWTKFTSHLEEYSLFFDALILRYRYFELDAKLRADARKYRYPEIDISDILETLFKEQGKEFSKEKYIRESVHPLW